jgi:hypothetical protein
LALRRRVSQPFLAAAERLRERPVPAFLPPLSCLLTVAQAALRLLLTDAALFIALGNMLGLAILFSGIGTTWHDSFLR